jgi:hypothetical protein
MSPPVTVVLVVDVPVVDVVLVVSVVLVVDDVVVIEPFAYGIGRQIGDDAGTADRGLAPCVVVVAGRAVIQEEGRIDSAVTGTHDGGEKREDPSRAQP